MHSDVMSWCHVNGVFVGTKKEESVKTIEVCK